MSRMPSSCRHRAIVGLDRRDLLVEAPVSRAAFGELLRAAGRSGRAPRGRCPTSRRSSRPRSPAGRGRSGSIIDLVNGNPGPFWTFAAHRDARHALDTARRSTRSYAPAWTPCAAKWIACWDEPHWRSTDVPGTSTGKPGGEPAVACDVDALLADLADATGDDVVDLKRVDAAALDDRLQRVGEKVDGVDLGQCSAGLAAYRAASGRLRR